MSVNYRSGISGRTGRPLIGAAHLEQSLDIIVTTFKTEIVMLLDFGFDPTRRLGRNISATLAAQFYRDLVTEVHRWEPEYRIARMQLVSLDRIGGLTLYVEGRYYPEGRLGNYAFWQPSNFNFPLSLMNRNAA
jgi:uncharacterized protein